MDNYEDKEVACIDANTNAECEKTFIFTAGEQKYYEDRSLNAPKRCPICRKKKRAQFPERSNNPSRGGYGRRDFRRDNNNHHEQY